MAKPTSTTCNTLLYFTVCASLFVSTVCTAEESTFVADRCFEGTIASDASLIAYCDLEIDAAASVDSDDIPGLIRLAAAYNNRAITRMRNGEYATAEADFASALAIAPTEAGIYLSRGSLRLRQRRWDEAIDDFSQALSFSEAPMPAAHYNMAFAHRALGNIYQAQIDVLNAQRQRRL